MSRLPLEGVRVLEATYVFALPYAAGILADLGAEVIKIEGPGRIDTTRNTVFLSSLPDAVAGEDPWNRTTTFHMLNRGKRSLSVDLSKEDGRQVLRDLIKVSDVFMENFTPRVMRGWGLDYPNLRRIKPDIILVSNTGYGHGSGPWSDYPAQATTQEATHGLTHVTGYQGDIPSKAGQSYVDFLSCWSALLGIGLALRYRHRTGKGQWVEIGMYQLGSHFVGEYIMDWIANGRLGERMGNRHPWRAPQGCYPCAGQDQWCAISVGDDEEWTSLCQVMGKPELGADLRFTSPLSRMRHHDELDKIIKEWTQGHDKFDVMEKLQGAGVPAGPVFDSQDTNLDKHYWDREFLEKVQFGDERRMGRRVLIGRPWRFSKTPLSIRGPAPMLGAHNREVLSEVLGYDDARCEELERAGLLSQRPANPGPPPTVTLEEDVRRGRFAYCDPEYKAKLGI